jgi:hypothetical protein
MTIGPIGESLRNHQAAVDQSPQRSILDPLTISNNGSKSAISSQSSPLNSQFY